MWMGLAIRSVGVATVGGLIMGANGEWVGFQRKIGSNSVLGAELWALRDGLKLALDLSLLDIEVEMDAMQATYH
ncbi:hypothetical protein RHGRI_018218 [Rhododendron griersonianum]|uniref:RNase H type-1 domain-containing protein n=1 Tax=Rhododendron griersonianum TaxID=479676 RepID=A0AAV6K0N6_9ERIC|nr:hypothetical protein RHGRI_018218 [Rhododendron griersonianum]